ncbi:MAG: hypothetical protein IPL32_17535 [Chloracidobacterium sp.]|nr:hypothetical protein [Chloracidobacterium sp.]
MLNEWRISEALTSVRRLMGVLQQMTDEELIEAIKLEEASLRRKHILEKLYRQSRVLARKTHQANIKEKIHGP